MTTSKGGQSGGKKGQRSRKPDRRGPDPEPVKAEQVKPEPVKAEPVKPEPVKPEPVQNVKPDPGDEHLRSSVAQAKIEAAPAREPAEPLELALSGEVIPPHAPISSDRPAGVFPPAIEAIAKAYGDYARQSFQTNRSFVERMIGVRSFEEAVVLQSEFARQAYENFVAESLKLCGLYGELARQVFRPFGGFAATIIHLRREAH
jgi:hypothetical protein